MSIGRIEVIAGCMFSGKTSELIRRVTRAEDAGLKVRVFKPVIDIRSGEEQILSHDDKCFPAINIQKPQHMLEHIDDDDQVIGIDEAQFFDANLVKVVNILMKMNLRVICSGLDTDWKGHPFGVMPGLLAVADQVDKLSGVCTLCGAPARRSQRMIENNDDILVGTSEYEPRCHDHFISRNITTVKVETAIFNDNRASESSLSSEPSLTLTPQSHSNRELQ